MSLLTLYTFSFQKNDHYLMGKQNLLQYVSNHVDFEFNILVKTPASNIIFCEKEYHKNIIFVK